MRRFLDQVTSGRIPAGLMVLALVALAGRLRSAVPGVNEAHYLTKSRHFWDPAWCANDLFLQSTDAHWLFFQTVGALTRWMSFPAAAWIGRCFGWGLLAWGFCQLARPLLRDSRHLLAAALLWVALSAPQGFSGEWLIGGIEAKVLAWGLGLAGLGAWLQGNGRQAALRLGLATSFHPVVGGWLALGWLIALPLDRWGPRRSLGSSPVAPDQLSHEQGSHSGSERTTESAQPLPIRGRVHWAHPLLLAFTALPGLLPVWQMLQAVETPQIQQTANRIQIFERLPHHLLPQAFPPERVAWSGLLLAVALFASQLHAGSREWRGLRWVLASALLFAMAGIGFSVVPEWVGLLRFYPFRLLDGLLPVVAALELVAAWQGGTLRETQPWWGRPRTGLAGLVVAVLLLLAWPQPDRVQPPWKPDNLAAWRDVCDWVSREVPPEAICLTPKYSSGFKWWAQRAEFATWKDCPQDAANLIEWKDRLKYVADWREKYFTQGFGPAALGDLRQMAAIDYVIAWNADPFSTEPLYRNGSFSVYRVPGSSQPGPADGMGLPRPPPITP